MGNTNNERVSLLWQNDWPHLLLLPTHLGRLTLSLGLPRATKGPGGGWASTGLFRASFSFLDLRASFFSSLAFSFSLSFSWSWWLSAGAPLLVPLLAGEVESFPLAVGKWGQTKEEVMKTDQIMKHCHNHTQGQLSDVNCQATLQRELQTEKAVYGKAQWWNTHPGAVRRSIQLLTPTIPVVRSTNIIF